MGRTLDDCFNDLPKWAMAFARLMTDYRGATERALDSFEETVKPLKILVDHADATLREAERRLSESNLLDDFWFREPVDGIYEPDGSGEEIYLGLVKSGDRWSLMVRRALTSPGAERSRFVGPTTMVRDAPARIGLQAVRGIARFIESLARDASIGDILQQLSDGHVADIRAGRLEPPHGIQRADDAPQSALEQTFSGLSSDSQGGSSREGESPSRTRKIRLLSVPRGRFLQ